MSKKNVPPYPKLSATVVTVHEDLLRLQEWIKQNCGIFNKICRASKVPSEVTVDSNSSFFYLTVDEFQSRGVVHVYRMLMAMRRIRECYDELSRLYGEDLTSAIVVDKIGVADSEVYDLLVSGMALLCVANLDIERREAAEREQILDIVRRVSESSDVGTAAAQASIREITRMLGFIFKVPISPENMV
jgi:hypothetical protein